MRKRVRQKNPNYVYVWKLHSEINPAKVVSIRAEPVNQTTSPITFGNRLLVQACVKFETMQVRLVFFMCCYERFTDVSELQSLEVYTKRGEHVAGDGKPKPVVEYLVFQKRMWYDTPWVVREQLYEGVQGRFSSVPQ